MQFASGPPNHSKRSGLRAPLPILDAAFPRPPGPAALPERPAFGPDAVFHADSELEAVTARAGATLASVRQRDREAAARRCTLSVGILPGPCRSCGCERPFAARRCRAGLEPSGAHASVGPKFQEVRATRYPTRIPGCIRRAEQLGQDHRDAGLGALARRSRDMAGAAIEPARRGWMAERHAQPCGPGFDSGSEHPGLVARSAPAESRVRLGSP